MNKLIKLITKWPVKTLLVMLVVLVILGVGATQINLKTGNNTLISDKTDIYKDNESYQNTFGKDPIIIIFDDEDLMSQDTLALMNQMQAGIANLDGVFSINSPVTVINQISKQMYEQTSTGLLSMSNGLFSVSNQLTNLSNQLLNNEMIDSDDLTNMTANLQQLINGQNQLETGLVNMFDILLLMKGSTTGVLNDLNQLKTQLESDPLLSDELLVVVGLLNDTTSLSSQIDTLLLSDGLKVIPPQTSQALSLILTKMVSLSATLSNQKTMLQTLQQGLLSMATNLGQMATSLGQIQSNFNAFKPGFPTSSDTLNNMVYDEGVLRPQFNGFIVSDHQVRMVVVLNGDVTDKQIDVIYQSLKDEVEKTNQSEDVLISGKPILDRSIKSSMMSSMQYMMISAVLIMVLILGVIYRVRMRLLPIVMILIGVVVTVGLMGILNIGLTMVSMAVFPVLIGLGIDYFIQFQTRYEEERGRL